MEETVWGVPHDWLPGMPESEVSGPGDPCAVVVAVTEDGTVVCAGWARFHQGTGFVSLWGGSARPQWRGRGADRATVAHRARPAVAAGYRFLQVDASPDSTPILARLGLRPVGGDRAVRVAAGCAAGGGRAQLTSGGRCGRTVPSSGSAARVSRRSAGNSSAGCGDFADPADRTGAAPDSDEWDSDGWDSDG